MGVLKSCIAAGAANCAMLCARIPCIAAGSASMGMYGASSGGTLNDAKIVRQSRSVNSAYDAGGSGRGVVVPNRRVKCVSFHRQRDKFAADVAVNFAVPWVVLVSGVLRMVEDAVSMVLAVRYVPV